ncbi:MAG: DUF2007 domain-containing protein [Ruminococcaceae bacterium]|nr:DUF2007 domain-containing protein [Oscillospiraceae bacterium]
MFFKRKKEQDEIVLAEAIANTVDSEIFQGILRENNIPFICRQQGASGYLKLIYGGLFAVDHIYVNKNDLEKAKELYESFVKANEDIEILDSEEK